VAPSTAVMLPACRTLLLTDILSCQPALSVSLSGRKISDLLSAVLCVTMLNTDISTYSGVSSFYRCTRARWLGCILV